MRLCTVFFFSSRRRHTRCALVTGVQTCALPILTGKEASEATRLSFRRRIEDNVMNDVEVEVEVEDSPSMPMEIPGMGGQVGMINLSDMMSKAFGQSQRKRRKMRLADAWDKLVEEEQDKRLDQDDVARTAVTAAEQNGIVFLDEIDKIAINDVRGASVNPEVLSHAPPTLLRT